MRKKSILSYLLLFASCSALADVIPEPCLDIHRSIGVSMTDAMINDFGIKAHDLLLNQTKMTLISKQNVTKKLAELYGHQSYKSIEGNPLKESDYSDIYRQSNAQNIIVEYDYINREHKHNIILASHIINDDECSIRFNGYIIVKREF